MLHKPLLNSFGLSVSFENEADANELAEYLEGGGQAFGVIAVYYYEKDALWYVSQYVRLMDGADIKEQGAAFKTVKGTANNG